MRQANFSRKNFLKLGSLTLLGSILAACAPEIEVQKESPTSPTALEEAIFTPTSLPTATRTVMPTQPQSTPTLTPTIPAAENSTPTMTQVGAQDDEILTAEQKDRLREAALTFVAGTEQEAIRVARSLGYIKNDGHPASVCGPLSVAILREAGLISKYVDLHDFWLLNPRDRANIKTLERTFPRDEFMWYQSKKSIAEFDFQSFPLKAGDFIYLYAGDPGSFEHMLTVARIDDEGRAFSVTNFDTPDGYVIKEVMLYDPSKPGTGKFFDWTDRKNYRFGLTGFGGFDLWRFSKPVRDAGPEEDALVKAIDQVIEKYGGKWFLLIKEVSQPNLYAREIRKPVHPASTIKVPIAMLFLKWLTGKYPLGIQNVLKHGVDGRSYEQLLRAMLVDSEENATESILKVLDVESVDLNQMLKGWGIESIDVTKRIAAAHDMAILFEGLYGNYLSDEARGLVLDALKVYTPGDDTRWGVFRKKLPKGYQFYNKRGTITDDFLVVADWAIVECPTSQGKKVFILGAFAFQGEQKTTYDELVKALEEMAHAFWNYVQVL
jgi:hypothetical protein